jgi:hypothetical protein
MQEAIYFKCRPKNPYKRRPEEHLLTGAGVISSVASATSVSPDTSKREPSFSSSLKSLRGKSGVKRLFSVCHLANQRLKKSHEPVAKYL